MQLTLAHKNLLTPKNLYCEKVLHLFPIQDINRVNLKHDFENFVNKLPYMATKPNDENKKNADPRLDSIISWKYISNSEAAKYKLPKGKDKHK